MRLKFPLPLCTGGEWNSNGGALPNLRSWGRDRIYDQIPLKRMIYGDLKCADSESVVKNIPNRARF